MHNHWQIRKAMKTGLPGNPQRFEILARVRLLTGSVVVQSRHVPTSGRSGANLIAISVTLLATLGPALAGPPERFFSHGLGGGGAFFGPSINPPNPDEVWIGSDMGDLVHSADFGRTWGTVDFRVLQGDGRL
jgi:hypothetical protein